MKTLHRLRVEYLRILGGKADFAVIRAITNVVGISRKTIARVILSVSLQYMML